MTFSFLLFSDTVNPALPGKSWAESIFASLCLSSVSHGSLVIFQLWLKYRHILDLESLCLYVQCSALKRWRRERYQGLSMSFLCGLPIPKTHGIWNNHSRILHGEKSALELNFKQGMVAYICDPELKKKIRKIQTKKVNSWPGEVVQQLRALTALAEYPGSILSTHMAADNRLLLHTLLVSMGARHTCSIQPCMQAKHPYTNNQTDISLHYILGTLNSNSIYSLFYC